MGSVLPGNEIMFVYRVIVTTLVAMMLVVLGVVYPRIKENSARKSILLLTALYLLCVFGMWG